MKCSVIIPAGGVGKRFGSNIPKQFVEINEVPVLIRTIRIFEEIDEVESIVIPVHSQWFTYTKEIINKFGIKKVKDVVVGGIERQDSVANAIHSKHVEDSDIILIHDAVRPFVSSKLVRKIIETAEETGAVIPATKLKDSIKEKTAHDIVVKTIDRSKLCNVQTPQGFWYDILLKAYTEASKASFVGTDSSSLVEFIGYKVTVIEGEDSNIKITTPFDLKLGKLILDDLDQ